MPLDQRSTFRIENIVNPAFVFGTVRVYFLIKGVSPSKRKIAFSLGVCYRKLKCEILSNRMAS